MSPKPRKFVGSFRVDAPFYVPPRLRRAYDAEAHRIVRAMKANPGVFAAGDRVSAPVVVVGNWGYRLRLARRFVKT